MTNREYCNPREFKFVFIGRHLTCFHNIYVISQHGSAIVSAQTLMSVSAKPDGQGVCLMYYVEIAMFETQE